MQIAKTALAKMLCIPLLNRVQLNVFLFIFLWFFVVLDEAEGFNNEWRNKAQSMNSHRDRSRYLPYTHR